MRAAVLEIDLERDRQDEKWGEQNHPDGTGENVAFHAMDGTSSYFRCECDKKAKEGTLTWVDILLEEVAEAIEEDDPIRLKIELTQVAAVAAAWVEAIGRRQQRGEMSAGVPQPHTPPVLLVSPPAPSQLE